MSSNSFNGSTPRPESWHPFGEYENCVSEDITSSSPLGSNSLENDERKASSDVSSHFESLPTTKSSRVRILRITKWTHGSCCDPGARRAVEDDYNDDTDVLWLDFGNYGRTNNVVGFMMEGLELLLWLARVSVDEFQGVVDELWPEEQSLEGETSFRTSRPQRIGIWLCMDTYIYLAGLGSTSENLRGLTASRDYLGARGVIQQVLRERHGVSSDSHQKPEILVHILPRILGSTGRVFFKTLPLIPDAMKRWLDAPDDTQDHEFHLRVTKLELTGASIDTNDPKLLSHLNALATCGVQLVGGRFNPVDKTLTRAARAIFLGLETLLQSHPCAAHSSTRGSGVWDLTFKYANDNPTILPGLFSAITATRSLRHISVSSYAQLNAIESIGLALCSSLARHSIKSVTLDLSRDGVLQRLLQALGRTDNPLAIIFDDHAASIRAYQHLRAAASRFALYDPTTHAKNTNVVVDTHEHKELQIISHNRPWWCVLLPAWDEAWVHDTDIQVTTVPSVALPQVGNPAIRKINVRGYYFQVADVVALVKLMNPSVEDLTLSLADSAGSDDVWATVVWSFPSLRWLSLDVSPHHLALLVSSIASLGAQRSLLTLKLDVRFDGNELDLLRDLIDVLADPSHAVSRCLDCLSLEAELDVSSDEVDVLKHQFGVMLDKNKRLVDLWFIGEMSRANLASSKALEQVLMAHHGSFVQVLAGSLCRRQKLAFLSTMQSTSSNLQLLDSEAVSIVFGFAARCRRRSVSVHMVEYAA